jgi:hypothetical protein
MKKFNLKIVSIAVVLATSGGAANAQWATFDAGNFGQSVITAAQTTITAAQSTLTSAYTFLTSRAAAATGQAVKAVGTSIDAQTAQSVQNVGTAATLEAVNNGHKIEADMVINMLPTLAMCAEASQSEAKAAPAAASMRSTGGGKSGSPARKLAVTNSATAMAETLNKKTSLGTCSSEIAGAAGCTGDGLFAGSDVHPRGIKGNTKGVSTTTGAPGTNAAYNNFTLEDGSNGAFDIAKEYASNMAYYDKPKIAPEAQMKKNPAYASIYNSMMTKLDAANDAVNDISKLKRESGVNITSSISGQAWALISDADYRKVTGLGQKPKDKPSLFDMINYSVRNDYFGNKDAKLESINEVNKRLAMTNFIAWNQYQQQENTNLLLSHILVQLTTPITKAQVDNEHAKTMIAK